MTQNLNTPYLKYIKNDTEPFKIEILGLFDYYKRWAHYYGWRDLFELSDTNYPKFFATGICSFKYKTILIGEVGDWQLRLLHEIGHSIGYGHRIEGEDGLELVPKGHVMHPWGIYRGWNGKDRILEEYENKFGKKETDILKGLIGDNIK